MCETPTIDGIVTVAGWMGTPIEPEQVRRHLARLAAFGVDPLSAAIIVGADSVEPLLREICLLDAAYDIGDDGMRDMDRTLWVGRGHTVYTVGYRRERASGRYEIQISGSCVAGFQFPVTVEVSYTPSDSENGYHSDFDCYCEPEVRLIDRVVYERNQALFAPDATERVREWM